MSIGLKIGRSGGNYILNGLLSPSEHSDPMARGKASRVKRQEDSSLEKLTSRAPEKRLTEALISVLVQSSNQ